MARRRRKTGSFLTGILLLLALTATVIVVINRFRTAPAPGRTEVYADAVDRTLNHYGDEVKLYAAEFNLPASYLLSLIVLESSGRRVIPPRFETHVYQRLKEVKEGERSSYEHVTRDHLTDATDDALKNLASSWGPFQLMGYKCLLLDIKVKDIRGNEAVYWGMKWINITYGNELRKGHYKDAFHIHNTGKRYPRIGKPFTHDPAYVDRGLNYMHRFTVLDSANVVR